MLPGFCEGITLALARTGRLSGVTVLGKFTCTWSEAVLEAGDIARAAPAWTVRKLESEGWALPDVDEAIRFEPRYGQSFRHRHDGLHITPQQFDLLYSEIHDQFQATWDARAERLRQCDVARLKPFLLAVWKRQADAISAVDRTDLESLLQFEAALVRAHIEQLRGGKF
jgi:hypothetical protein